MTRARGWVPDPGSGVSVHGGIDSSDHDDDRVGDG